MAEKKNQRTVKELRQEQMTTKGKGYSNGNEKAKPRHKKQKCENTSSEDEEWPCLICVEPSENKHSGFTSIGAHANLSMLTTLKYCLAQGPIVL